MESYAYLILSAASESPTNYHLNGFEGMKWRKFSSQTYRCFLSFVVFCTIVTVAQTAQALLVEGDSNAQVTQVQQRLQQLGFFNSAVTGYFGSLTRDAVIRFQQSRGLAVDGIVGPNTLTALGLTPTQPSNPIPPITNNLLGLRLNDSGSTVLALQQRLRELGFFNANPTGYFGDITRDAVIRFQQANFLAATGIVCNDMVALLNSSSPYNPNPNPNITLGFGDYGQDVGTLQQRLKQLGFYFGEITNYFDEATEDAVQRFQVANRITPTGQVGTTTQAVLVTQVPYIQVPNSPGIPANPSSPGVPGQFLSLGDRGAAVSLLQQRLQTLRYYNGPINSVFDLATQKAVIDFQRAYRIVPTGQVGPTTLSYLVQAAQSSSPTPLSYQYPQYWQSSEYLSSPVTQPINNSAALRLGDTGLEVRRIQRRLRELNYYNGGINGFYDRSLEDAVISFQRANNLPGTGFVDAATQALMFNTNRASTFSNFTTVASSQTNVLELQKRLNIQGLYNGPINGIYNTQTELAVVQAQNLYGASADAVLYGGL